MIKREAYQVAKDRVKIGYFTEKGMDIRGIVHVGANDGYEIQWYLAMGITNIMAFEPLPSAFKLLKEYQVSNVHCYNFGLGKEDVRMTLNVTPGDGKGSSYLEIINNSWDYEIIDQIECEIKRFDSWYFHVFPYGPTISDYDCLVVDVEGMELDVLEGMGTYLDGFNMLNIEVRENVYYKNSALADEVIDFLIKKGFKQETPTVDVDDVLFSRI